MYVLSLAKFALAIAKLSLTLSTFSYACRWTLWRNRAVIAFVGGTWKCCLKEPPRATATAVRRSDRFAER